MLIYEKSLIYIHSQEYTGEPMSHETVTMPSTCLELQKWMEDKAATVNTAPLHVHVTVIFLW